jgi:Flp pilus assembly pilin Flp
MSEVGVLLAVVVAVAVGAFRMLGGNLSRMVSNVAGVIGGS